MRLIALMIAIAGALLAFGYPAWIDLGSGAEIGRYAISTRPGGAPGGPTLTLSPADAPVGLFLTLSVPDVAPKPAQGAATATYEVGLSRGGNEIDRAEAGFRFTYPANDKALRPTHHLPASFL